MPSGSYSYITFGQLKAELLNRLQDTAASYTPSAEAGLYLIEGLRVLNAQTAIWNEDYEFQFNPGDTWRSLNVSGSPRQRTIQDSDIYNQMEAMLLEPMTGGTWTGTPQFNIAMLSAALQYRRDELLLQSAANVVNIYQPSPTVSARTYLPDSTLNLHRVRWVPTDTTVMPYALGREDVVSRNAFGVQLTTATGEPDSWMITANTPLSFDASCVPNQAGEWDMLASYSGPTFNTPSSTLVGLPNDWCWVAMYGALADVLSNAPEGRDNVRSKYCLERYEHGRKSMTKLAWLIEAQIGDMSVDTPSVIEMDAWNQNWEMRQDADDPQVVVGSVDLVAIAPFIPSTGVAVDALLTLVGNAPVPVIDADPIQLSRDGVEAVLSYAQHVASFKMGGSNFTSTGSLLKQFDEYCRLKNAQYAALGIFRPEMLMEGNRGDFIDPKFQSENKVKKSGE